MCLNAGLIPRTRTINKPLLSLSLSRFGFAPTNQRGEVVAISDATRLRDCTRREFRGHFPGRTAYVRTSFEPPIDGAALAYTVDGILGDGLRLEASSAELRRALTLRGGAMHAVPCRGIRKAAPHVVAASSSTIVPVVVSTTMRTTHARAAAEAGDVSDELSGAQPGLLHRLRKSLKFDRAALSRYGANAFLTYGLVSNWSSGLLTSLAWATFARRAGVSPLAPGQWKPFFLVYTALYATIGTLIRPLRFALAISLTPTFEAALLRTRSLVPYARTKPGLNRALALIVLILIGNVGITGLLTACGVWLAATVTGVPIFPSPA